MGPIALLGLYLWIFGSNIMGSIAVTIASQKVNHGGIFLWLLVAVAYDIFRWKPGWNSLAKEGTSNQQRAKVP